MEETKNTVEAKGVIISEEDFNEFKKIREDYRARQSFKMELKLEVMKELTERIKFPSNDTYTTEHNLKGLGYFGGFIAFGGIFITLLSTHAAWGWYSIPIIGLMFLLRSFGENLV